MSVGTILLVHGTGVRLQGFRSSFEAAKKRAQSLGIEAEFVGCAWGDPLGVEFEGLSLPDPPSEQQLREDSEDYARWSWLFDDPLFELDKLTIRDTGGAARQKGPPGRKPEWLTLWERIRAYHPSPELDLVLKRGGLQDLWPAAWATVAGSEVTRLAYERSAHELPVASRAMARAIVAELHVLAADSGLPGPSRTLRDRLVGRLLDDWGQVVYAPTDFFANLFKRAATRSLRRHRNGLSAAIMLPIGDVLLYQTRGSAVRDFIRSKIVAAKPPITIVGHSLGGVACFDLLALPGPPEVARLVTVGSQPSLLYEIGALASIKPPMGLPKGFPPWLNIYDRNDLLSYIAARLFPSAEDHEVTSGQPFPESHSAYLSDEAVWNAIRGFVAA
jgi:hypothetical protein